jgi:hypothetical protein
MTHSLSLLRQRQCAMTPDCLRHTNLHWLVVASPALGLSAIVVLLLLMRCWPREGVELLMLLLMLSFEIRGVEKWWCLLVLLLLWGVSSDSSKWVGGWDWSLSSFVFDSAD